MSGNAQQMADVQRMLKHAAEEADGHRVIGQIFSDSYHGNFFGTPPKATPLSNKGLIRPY